MMPMSPNTHLATFYKVQKYVFQHPTVDLFISPVIRVFNSSIVAGAVLNTLSLR